MLNTTETLICIVIEKKTKKAIVIDSSDDEENEKRRMRTRKNKESIDEISQGLLIKQKKNTKKIANCSSRNGTKTQKKNNKSKGRN